MAWERRDEYVFHAPPLAESVARAKALGLANPGAPVLLIDHCDNCGSGGAQDVMTVVAEVLRQELDDVAIAPIRDPAAVATMIDAGVGQRVRLTLGGHTDMPSIGLAGEPLRGRGPRAARSPTASSSITGPMYTGVRTLSRTHRGRSTPARRRSSSPSARTSRSTSACSRTRASTRARKRYVMLKSRIHYRAGFKPIASHIVECAGAGVTNADLSVYPYRKLTRPIFPLDPM